MKTLKLIFIGVVLFLSSTVEAQVSVNVNIGPLWGPVGYTDVQYYYLPDVQAYYDIQAAMFIYYAGGVWIHRSYLPTRYRTYDLFSGYKVVMTDYHGNTPYTNYNVYKTKYYKGYHGSTQKTIGEHPGNGNSHPKTITNNHSNGNSNQYHSKGNVHQGNNNSHGQGNGNSHGQGHGKKK